MDNEIIEGLIKTLNRLGAEEAQLSFEINRDESKFTVNVVVTKEN